MLLCQYPGITVVDDARPGDGHTQEHEDNPVDVVLLDALQGADATAARIGELKSALPAAKVIVIGVREVKEEILAYIEAGASGYTVQESSVTQLIDTIRTVHRGEASCSPDILALLFDRIASLKGQVHWLENTELSKLTRRELEVLQLVVEGMSNKEIASRLNLELQTVKNYVHSILDKLRVHNRREAALYARELAPSEKAS